MAKPIMPRAPHQLGAGERHPQLGIRDRRAAELGQWRRRASGGRGFSRGLVIAIVIACVLGAIASYAFPVPQL
jgi:hypothetical protein